MTNMNVNKGLFLAYIFAICLTNLANTNILFAQDVLFLYDGSTESGVYQGIDGNKILYQPFNSDKSEKIKRKQVAMISNPQGWVRVFQKDKEVLISFPNDSYDLIITSIGEVIKSNEVLVHDTMVEYEKFQSLSKDRLPLSSVTAVVYKTKQVLPLVEIKQVANTFVRMHNAGKFDLSSSDSPHTANIPSILDAEGTVVFETDVNISEEDQVDAETPRGIEENEGTPFMGEENSEAPVKASPQLNYKEGPTLPISETEFREKALRKTDQFSGYIKRVVDKGTSRFEANKAINQAITLFVHDSSLVEVSNVKSNKKYSYFIREYLYHIQELKYDRVEIDWAEVSYVGDIKLGPDGNWYGSVTFLQVFKGFRDGQLLYEDKTLKRMEVILKGYEKVREGKTEVLWDVLLSNIAVEHTS